MARPKPTYDVEKVVEDMAVKGLDIMGLARESSLSHMTVRRFLDGHAQTIKTATRLARALGYSPRRYFAGVTREAA